MTIGVRVLSFSLTSVLALGLGTAAWAQEGAAPAATPPVPPASSGGEPILKGHQEQLLSFQERLSQLATKISVAEAKLDTLKSTVLAGVAAGARAVVIHQNDLGENFVLERAEYLLDGGVLLDKENTDGSLDRQKRFELFNGLLPPGTHEVKVNLIYRGSSFGNYTYLAGYKFKVESKYVLSVVDGRLNTLTIVTHEKPNVTEETKDRMAVRYDLEVTADPKANAAAAPSPAP